MNMEKKITEVTLLVDFNGLVAGAEIYVMGEETYKFPSVVGYVTLTFGKKDIQTLARQGVVAIRYE
jgi:hypothetical protein